MPVDQTDEMDRQALVAEDTQRAFAELSSRARESGQQYATDIQRGRASAAGSQFPQRIEDVIQDVRERFPYARLSGVENDAAGERRSAFVGQMLKPTPDYMGRTAAYVGSRLPFVGSTFDYARRATTGADADLLNRMLENGHTPTADQYAAAVQANDVSQFMDGRHGIARTAADVVSQIPAFMVEYYAAGPAGLGVRGLSARLLPRLVGTGRVGNAATWAASRVADAATRNAVMPRTLANTAIGFAENGTSGAANAYLDQQIEVLSEMAGGRLLQGVGLAGSGIARAVRAQAVAEGLTKWASSRMGSTRLQRALAEHGWHGIFGEFLEERFGDTLRGAAGLAGAQGDFGMIGDATQGALGDQAARQRALDQLVVEGLAFGTFGAGTAIAGARLERHREAARAAVDQLMRRGVSRTTAEQRVVETATRAMNGEETPTTGTMAAVASTATDLATAMREQGRQEAQTIATPPATAETRQSDTETEQLAPPEPQPAAQPSSSVSQPEPTAQPQQVAAPYASVSDDDILQVARQLGIRGQKPREAMIRAIREGGWEGFLQQLEQQYAPQQAPSQDQEQAAPQPTPEVQTQQVQTQAPEVQQEAPRPRAMTAEEYDATPLEDHLHAGTLSQTDIAQFRRETEGMTHDEAMAWVENAGVGPAMGKLWDIIGGEQKPRWSPNRLDRPTRWTAQLPGGYTVVAADVTGRGLWDIAFADQDLSMATTGKAGSKAIKTLRLVTKLVNEFVERNRPSQITFTSRNERGRLAVYTRLAHGIRDKFGYSLETWDHGKNETAFGLLRQEQDQSPAVQPAPSLPPEELARRTAEARASLGLDEAAPQPVVQPPPATPIPNLPPLVKDSKVTIPEHLSGLREQAIAQIRRMGFSADKATHAVDAALHGNVLGHSARVAVAKIKYPRVQEVIDELIRRAQIEHAAATTRPEPQRERVSEPRPPVRLEDLGIELPPEVRSLVNGLPTKARLIDRMRAKGKVDVAVQGKTSAPRPVHEFADERVLSDEEWFTRSKLNDREKAIAKLMFEGHNGPQIAEILDWRNAKGQIVTRQAVNKKAHQIADKLKMSASIQSGQRARITELMDKFSRREAGTDQSGKPLHSVNAEEVQQQLPLHERGYENATADVLDAIDKAKKEGATPKEINALVRGLQAIYDARLAGASPKQLEALAKTLARGEEVTYEKPQTGQESSPQERGDRVPQSTRGTRPARKHKAGAGDAGGRSVPIQESAGPSNAPAASPGPQDAAGSGTAAGPQSPGTSADGGVTTEPQLDITENGNAADRRERVPDRLLRRSERTRALSPGHARATDIILRDLAAANITDARKDEYLDHWHEAVSNMTPELADVLARNLKGAQFFSDLDALNSFLAPKSQKLREMMARGKRAGGAAANGVLYLDGKNKARAAAQTYAHEIFHIIDNRSISTSPEWLAAFDEARHITEYAATSPSEALAEAGRQELFGGLDPAKTPKMLAFFRSHNLTSLKRTGQKVGELFKTPIVAGDLMADILKGGVYRKLESDPHLELMADEAGRPTWSDYVSKARNALDSIPMVTSFVDAFENRLAALQRWERALAKAGKSGKAADWLYTVYRQMKDKAGQWGQQFTNRGIEAMVNGQMQVIGPSINDLNATLTPEDQKPVNFDADRAAPLKPYLANPGEWTPAALYIAGSHLVTEQNRGKPAVSDEQMVLWREYLANTPAEAAARYRAAHKVVTAINNSSLDARVSVGNLSQEKRDLFVADKPDYVELSRSAEEPFIERERGTGYPMTPKRRKGESDRPLISPIESVKARFYSTAAVMSEQIRRNNAQRFLELDLKGWSSQANESDVQTWLRIEKGGNVGEQLLTGDTTPEQLESMLASLRNLGATVDEYFMPRPWKPGTPNLFPVMQPDGTMKHFKIENKALYHALTHTQGNGNLLHTFLNSFAEMSIGDAAQVVGADIKGTKLGDVKPFRVARKVGALGATGLNPGFVINNTVNPFFDPLTYVANTTDPKSVFSVPGMVKRMAMAEYAIATGEIPKDTFARWVLTHMGRDMHFLGFEPTKADLKNGMMNTVVTKGQAILKASQAGELAPRAVAALKAAEKMGYGPEFWAKAGEEMDKGIDPVQFLDGLHIIQAMSESTVDFGRGGYLTDELNKIALFWRPSIAALSKQIRNTADNPRGAMLAMAITLAAKLAHYLRYKDEEWYAELSAYDRYNNFIIPVGGKLYRLKGPRGANEVGVGAFTLATMDWMRGKNPRAYEAMVQTMQAAVPPVPLPPIVSTAWELQGNADWRGSPIVPNRDQHLPFGERFWNYYLPHAGRGLTGGLTETAVNAAGAVGNLAMGDFGAAGDRLERLSPIRDVGTPSETVNRLFDRLNDLEGQRISASRRGQPFEQEQEYRQLARAAERIRKLAMDARGQHMSGGRLVTGQPPPESEVRELRQQQVAIARAMLTRQ